MERMFSHGAEFGNLLETEENLMVSKVVHKAFIEVNEEGAEAAAATGKFLLFYVSCFHPLFNLCCTHAQTHKHFS